MGVRSAEENETGFDMTLIRVKVLQPNLKHINEACLNIYFVENYASSWFNSNIKFKQTNTKSIDDDPESGRPRG